MTRVTLLAGGVGGAKLAEGLAEIPEIALTVIGNVADDDQNLKGQQWLIFLRH